MNVLENLSRNRALDQQSDGDSVSEASTWGFNRRKTWKDNICCPNGGGWGRKSSISTVAWRSWFTCSHSLGSCTTLYLLLLSRIRHSPWFSTLACSVRAHQEIGSVWLLDFAPAFSQMQQLPCHTSASYVCVCP